MRLFDEVCDCDADTRKCQFNRSISHERNRPSLRDRQAESLSTHVSAACEHSNWRAPSLTEPPCSGDEPCYRCGQQNRSSSASAERARKDSDVMQTSCLTNKARRLQPVCPYVSIRRSELRRRYAADALS